MTSLVIGIGHVFRGDDAIGPAVVEAVAAMNLPGVTTLVHHGEGTALMECWAGHDRVVVVDATVSGQASGTVRTWYASRPLPRGVFSKSSHVFGLAEAVEMARTLGRLPATLTIIGVEGGGFALGQALSPEVAAALPEAVHAVLAAL